jgi:hypothetical protein
MFMNAKTQGQNKYVFLTSFAILRQILSPVFEAHDAGGFGTVDAAEHLPVVFHAMANNSTTAMVAHGGQRVYGAFKAVKRVCFTR